MSQQPQPNQISGIHLDRQDVLAVPPAVVLYGPPGAGKSFEMARSFPNALYVQSSASLLRAYAGYAQAQNPPLKVPDRVTIDESTIMQLYGGSTLNALISVLTSYIAACDAGKCQWDGIIFDEWNVFCERIFDELKADPWNKFRGRSGAVNIFAVMDAFRQTHRQFIGLARRTRRMVGFVAHHQPPRYDEDENSPTRGQIKHRGGPKMPQGMASEVTSISADADVVLQLNVVPRQGGLGEKIPEGTVDRYFLTALDDKWFRKFRGFVSPVEPLDITKGQGLRELLLRAHYRL